MKVLILGLYLFLVTFIFVACTRVEATRFEFGSNPEQPRLLPGASSIKKGTRASFIKRESNLEEIEFRSTWVVEFNDLIASSPEEFGEQHNLYIRQITGTNKYSVQQKVVSYGRDSRKEEVLRLDPRIRSLEFEIPRSRFPRQVPTTDPGLCNQWHLWKCPTSLSNYANINIAPAWNNNFTGAGIQIAVVDDGVQYTHPDLSAGYVAADSYDFFANDADPSPDFANEDFHGTACAGLAAAQTNTYCGVGAAYKAKFAAIRLTAGDTTDSQETSALTYKSSKNLIYTNSWGPSDDGLTLEGPGPLLLNAFANSETARGGKGSIYTWAAGNGRQNYDQSTKDGYASNPHVISVSAIGVSGKIASYSEPGASNFICSPGGDSDGSLYTTDATSTNGYQNGDCTNNFIGTSGATPIVAGGLAMILEANPDLTARDLRRIVGLTATKNDPRQKELPWFMNGARHWINYYYGFGLINVNKAIAAAKIWTSLPATTPTPAASAAPKETIMENCYDFAYAPNVTIEYISLYVDIVHPYRGDLGVNVTSPSGTTVILLFAEGFDSNPDLDWTFYSYFFLDEYSSGSWRICVVDLYNDTDTGTISSYSFKVFGRPLELSSTLVVLDSITPPNPIQGDMVELVLTFSDEVGIFIESIDSGSILVGNQVTAVEILSTTPNSVTAKFLANSTNLVIGTNQIKTGQVAVQNKWLYPMQTELVIGNFTLTEPPPQASIPVSPSGQPVQSQPIKTPSPQKVSKGLVIIWMWELLAYLLFIHFKLIVQINCCLCPSANASCTLVKINKR